MLKINNDTQLNELIENIATKIKVGDVITLQGDLGVGKTYFSSHFINFFLKKNKKLLVNVTSPTFNIVKGYDVGEFSIYHFDLYRLKSIDELYELDIYNILENNVSLIEWPEIAQDILGNVKFKIKIELINNDRFYTIEEYNI